MGPSTLLSRHVSTYKRWILSDFESPAEVAVWADSSDLCEEQKQKQKRFSSPAQSQLAVGDRETGPNPIFLAIFKPMGQAKRSHGCISFSWAVSFVAFACVKTRTLLEKCNPLFSGIFLSTNSKYHFVSKKKNSKYHFSYNLFTSLSRLSWNFYSIDWLRRKSLFVPKTLSFGSKICMVSHHLQNYTSVACTVTSSFEVCSVGIHKWHVM